MNLFVHLAAHANRSATIILNWNLNLSSVCQTNVSHSILQLVVLPAT